MLQSVNKDLLKKYISSNEVVYQTFGGLIEVSNDNEKENKDNLLSYLDSSSNIEVYAKDYFFIKEDFEELNDWSLITLVLRN